MVITTLFLPPAPLGSAYSQTLAVTGATAPLNWTVNSGNFPAWASLAPLTGVLSGTPQNTGCYVFQVQIVDALGLVAQQVLSLVTGNTLISDVATWVTGSYLNRTDITAIAQDAALAAYRVITAKICFDELIQLSPEIPLVANQDTYDLGFLVPPLLGIVDIRLTFSSSTSAPVVRRRLRRSNARVYDSLSFTNASYPATYARTSNLAIQLIPPPVSSTFTIRIRYWTRPPEATPTSGTMLVTPLEWDELMRWETAWRVLNTIGQEQRAMALIQPMPYPRQRPNPRKQQMMEVGIIPRLWNELLTTRSQKEAVDEDFNINPLIRPYSVRP